MPLRKSVRQLAAAAALVVAATALTSCGFDYATDRDYTPGEGVSNRDAMVDVLSAVIVSGQQGSGTFVASFANNETDKEASVTGLSGSTSDGGALKFDTFSPITVPAGGLVNLATDGGVSVTGDIEAGDFVDLTVTFGDGDSVDMKVPTVANCGDYAGLDDSGTPDPAQCEVETPDTAEH